MTDDADRLVPFGKIGRPHGVRGEVRIFTDDPHSETLAHVPRVTIRLADGAERTCEIKNARFGGRFWIVRLDTVSGRDAAQALTHAIVLAERELLPEPEDDDEIYACDLVGLPVVSPTGEDLGVLEDVYDNGGHDVLVYRSPEGKRRLVPFVEAYVHEVDLDQGRVTLEPLEYAEGE